MLDDYKDGQPVAYNLLKNEIINNHISHAYLFDENNYTKAFDMVKAFVKEIITNTLESEEKNNICRRIDDDMYPEIKIIMPDGMLIKKQQILDLQLDFSRSAVEGNKRIYIIREADKMRSETANSMLKFLEEPDSNIVAILMTNNYNNLLQTIISRCQVIKLASDEKNEIEELDKLVLNFLENIEKKGVSTILNEQELLFNVISVKDRNKLIDFFDKMIDMYYDIMKIIVGSSNIKYSQFLDVFKSIADKNTESIIFNKINFLIESKDRIKNNVNMNLLIDSIIVKFGGKNERSWC